MYCTILIGIVTCRQWEVNEEVEEVLKHILKTKKHSTEASTRYSNFVTHFWSKKSIHENFNDYELTDEVKSELENFQNPYSYYS